MKLSLNTARYLKPGLVIACLVTVLLCADTLLWWRTTRMIEREIATCRMALQTAGWTTTVERTSSGGWPFGAWITLSSPRLRHEQTVAAPFDAGWSGTTLRAGGSWLDLMRTDLHVFLSGRNAARFLSLTVQATVLSQDLHLGFSGDQNTTFKAPSAEIALTTEGLDQSASLTEVSGRLLAVPHAAYGATRLGFELSARSLHSPALPSLQLSARDIRFIAALTSSTRKDTASFFSLEGYDRLLLQTATFSFGDANRLSFSGALDLPAATGHLTLTLLNWHEAVEQLLKTVPVRTALPPDLQIILERTLHNQSPVIVRNNQSVSLDIPVVNGHFPMPLETLLQNIPTQKIDVSHSRE